MNLFYHYPSVYWNCACLTINAGADDSQEDNKSTQYGKCATAIGKMQGQGVVVELPLINESNFGFKPNPETNTIIFGLKGLHGIGDAVAYSLISNRPYKSMDDFYTRMIDTKEIKPAQMSKLIKAGCFTKLDNEDRNVTMRNFIERTVFSPNTSLTFANLKKIQEFDLIPEHLHLSIRIKDFNPYIFQDKFLVKEVIDETKKKVPKCGYHDRLFKLDSKAMSFFTEHFTEKSVVDVKGESYIISEKLFTKEWNVKLLTLKEWMCSTETLELFNNKVFQTHWDKLAKGTIPKWEMDSLSFYYTEHELKNMNEALYGVSNYFELPEKPEAYEYYVRYINKERKEIPKNTITRLAGTVLDRDNNKHTITLLTLYGVVTVKFNKGQYAFYNKRISVGLDENSDKKTVLEESWFVKGSTIMVCGYREGDTFRAYRYKDTIYLHTVNRILDLLDDGTVTVQTDRVKV